MKRVIAQRLRAAMVTLHGDTARQGEHRDVRDLSGEPYPEAVFLFAGLGPEARKALEVFPHEAQAWRALAEMEAARARLWSGQGRVWDAGMCAGRAQAYRAAADQVEEVLIESLELWDQYERQVDEGEGEGGR